MADLTPKTGPIIIGGLDGPTADPLASRLSYSKLPAYGAHTEYYRWFPYWKQIRDCITGTSAIKAWAFEYLKPRDGQDIRDYQQFLDAAVFFNMTDKTRQGLVGSVFDRFPIFTKFPPKMETLFDYSEKITKNGESLFEMLVELTSEVVSVGRYGILVDNPPEPFDDDGLPTTPYLATYRAEDIVNWMVQVNPKTGILKLVQVVLREFLTELNPSGIGYSLKEHVRVLDLTSGIYKQYLFNDPTETNLSLNTGKAQVITPLLNGNPLTYIPFFFFGSTSNSPKISKPPLADISDLNVSHYNSYALLEMARRYTATPIYWVKGDSATNNDELTVSANTVWGLGKDEAAGILEFHGNGLTSLENALNDKASQVQTLGGKLTTQNKKAPATSSDAVNAALDVEEAMLNLSTNNIRFGIIDLLKEFFKWNNCLPGTFSEFDLELNRDEEDSPAMDSKMIRALQGLYDSGLLPAQSMFDILLRAKVYPPEFTYEDFKTLLQIKGETPEVIAPSGTPSLEPAGTPQIVNANPAGVTTAVKIGDANNTTVK